MDVRLDIDKRAAAERKKKLAAAQSYVDSECMRQMRPYVPVALPRYKNAGELRDSAVIAKPGRIEYRSKFAKSDYYKRVDHRHGGNPAAKRKWFEYMKSRCGRAILRGAAETAGGKA